MRINLLLLAAGIVIGVLLARIAGCNNTTDCSDITVIHDTIPVKDSTDWYKPTPQVAKDEPSESYERGVAQILPSDLPGYVKPYKPVPHKTEPGKDTSTYSWFVPDTLIGRRLFDVPAQGKPETVYYNDTAHTKYGNVIIQDTLQDNRIKARRVLTAFQIPSTTTTVIQKTPARNRLYLGINAYGSKATWIMGVGPSLQLATKGGKAWEVGAYMTRGEPVYFGGVKFNLLKN